MKKPKASQKAKPCEKGCENVAKASDNLIPQAHKLTLEEQSAGGKASVKARREKKAFKELLEMLLEEEVKDTKGNSTGLTRKEALAITAIQIGLSSKAKDKDKLEAFRLIRDTIGEAPKERLEVTGLEEQQNKVDELLAELREDETGEEV